MQQLILIGGDDEVEDALSGLYSSDTGCLCRNVLSQPNHFGSSCTSRIYGGFCLPGRISMGGQRFLCGLA